MHSGMVTIGAIWDTEMKQAMVDCACSCSATSYKISRIAPAIAKASITAEPSGAMLLAQFAAVTLNSQMSKAGHV